jgi:hypothetical protein
MEEQRKNFRISPPPIPLPPGVEGPKRFVKNKAESNGLRGELQTCSNLDSVVLAVLIGTPGSFAVFQSLLEKSGFTVTEIDELPSFSFLHEYVGGGPLVNIIPSPPEVRGRGSSGDPAAAPPEVREARRREAAARVDADVARRAQHAQSTELDRVSSVSDSLSKSEGELRVELAATKAELERSDERATKLAAEVAAERRRHDEMAAEVAAERRRHDEMAAERRRQDEMASIFLEMLRRSEVREQEAREREARRCCSIV